MIYTSLLLAMLLSHAQPSVESEPPQEAPATTEQAEAETPAQETPAAVEPPAPVAPQTNTPPANTPPTPPPPTVSTFDIPKQEMKEIEGKPIREQALMQFCNSTGLSNCSLSIMRPKKAGLTGATMSLLSVVDGTADGSAVMAFILHSPRLLTPKESVEFLTEYNSLFPPGIEFFTPSRVLKPKTKRKSSLVLAYEWTVDIGFNKLPGRLFLLKNPKNQSSFLIFTIAPSKQQMTSSPMVRFLYSDLDVAK